MSERNQSVDILERIVRLEMRVTSTIERLDRLIDQVELRFQQQSSIYTGDSTTPSLLSRVISLEDSRKNIQKSLVVLYTAIVSALVKLLMDRL